MTIPDSHDDLVKKPISVVFATIMPDGMPQTTVVWRMWREGEVLISAHEHGQKIKNVRRDPRVNMMTVAPENWLHYLEVRGEVVEILPDPDAAFIDEMSIYYTGKPYYGGVESMSDKGKFAHVTMRIRPIKIRAF